MFQKLKQLFQKSLESSWSRYRAARSSIKKCAVLSQDPNRIIACVFESIKAIHWHSSLKRFFRILNREKSKKLPPWSLANVMLIRGIRREAARAKGYSVAAEKCVCYCKRGSLYLSLCNSMQAKTSTRCTRDLILMWSHFTFPLLLLHEPLSLFTLAIACGLLHLLLRLWFYLLPGSRCSVCAHFFLRKPPYSSSTRLLPNPECLRNA